MIRPATLADLDYLVEAATDYMAVSAEGKFLTLDPDAFRQNLEVGLAQDNVIMLVDDEHRGHIVGLVLPSAWNPAERIARVASIWVVPAHRGTRLAGDLIRAFEEAVPADVKAVMIDANESLEPDRTAALYERRGYHLEQRLFVKVNNGR